MSKTAANDLQVGEIHFKVNKIIDAAADAIIKQIEDDPDAAAFVNMKDVAVMMAWCEKNNVRAPLAIDSEQSDARAKLKEIKAKHSAKKLGFVDEDGSIREAI